MEAVYDIGCIKVKWAEVNKLRVTHPFPFI